VLSLSKHRPFSGGAKKERPFDKLRANGEWGNVRCHFDASD
jgi:hypothetical protein